MTVRYRVYKKKPNQNLNQNLKTPTILYSGKMFKYRKQNFNYQILDLYVKDVTAKMFNCMENEINNDHKQHFSQRD